MANKRLPRKTAKPAARKPKPASRKMTSINIGGGASIKGTVKTKGDFVGRDKKTVNNFFGRDRKKDDARKKYLTWFYNSCQDLLLTALGGEGVSEEVLLSHVYTELDTTHVVELQPEKKSRVKAKRADPERKPQKAREAADLFDRLSLLGDPGGGKSTFVKHLLAQLALTQLKKGAKWDYAHIPRTLTPVLIILRDLDRRLQSLPLKGRTPPEQGKLLAEAVAEHAAAALPSQQATFAAGLKAALSAGEVLLALDGLDEVPPSRRPLMRQAVGALLHEWRPKRVIVTCRERSYTGDAVLPNFEPRTIAPFDQDKIDAFVGAWYGRLRDAGKLEKVRAASYIAALSSAARAGELGDMPGNPMLLTTMAIVQRQETELPRQKVRLFKKAIEILTRKWQLHKTDEVDPALKAVLDNEGLLRRVLNGMGYATHAAQSAKPSLDAESKDSGDLARGDALALLSRKAYFNDAGIAERFLDYIDERAGLIVGRGGGEDGDKPATYGFVHRYFQEYLAGRFLLTNRDFEEAARECLTHAAAGDVWTVAAQLGADELLYNDEASGPQTLRRLAYELCPAEDEPHTPAQWRATVWAGYMAARLGEEAIKQDANAARAEAFLARIKQRLVDAFPHTTLTPLERAEAGRALGYLGDPRQHVLEVDQMRFARIPAGPFWFGESDEATQIDAPEFWMAEAPVTNAQFDAFIKAGGYKDKRFWAEAAKAGVWKKGSIFDYFSRDGRELPGASGLPFDLPNHPIVNITWYEALAFTRWLSERWRAHLPKGWTVRLPVEMEWEKAARGGTRVPEVVALCALDGISAGSAAALIDNPDARRRYPWPGAFDAARANTSESAIRTTSAVGVFGAQEQPYGLVDLSGNVCEWCLNKYESGQGTKQLAQAEIDASTAYRTWRGGAFNGDQNLARVAYRNWFYPDFSVSYLGFRVSVSPASL